MEKAIDLTGQKFGKLTVIERVGNDKEGRAKWLCSCECGTKKVVCGKLLRNGNTVSCGCHKKELIIKRSSTHGMGNTRIYNTWKNIKKRCLNSSDKGYHNYGGRGITICKEWKEDFANFYNWAMANGYKDNLTIDRINNDGNYEPSNCRWVTMKKQNNNRRSNRILTMNNNSHTLTEWSEITGIDRDVMRVRLNRGWSIEKALTQPVDKRIY